VQCRLQWSISGNVEKASKAAKITAKAYPAKSPKRMLSGRMLQAHENFCHSSTLMPQGCGKPSERTPSTTRKNDHETG
jgi:hypothetical protein